MICRRLKVYYAAPSRMQDTTDFRRSLESTVSCSGPLVSVYLNILCPCLTLLPYPSPRRSRPPLTLTTPIVVSSLEVCARERVCLFWLGVRAVRACTASTHTKHKSRRHGKGGKIWHIWIDRSAGSASRRGLLVVEYDSEHMRMWWRVTVDVFGDIISYVWKE